MKSIAIASILAVSMTAQAEFMDGNKLLSEMNGNFGNQMSALGYVSGVTDTLMGVTVCPPSTITVGQVHDMTKKYLEQFPADRHNSADRIIGYILKSAWPCAKKGNGV